MTCHTKSDKATTNDNTKETFPNKSTTTTTHYDDTSVQQSPLFKEKEPLEWCRSCGNPLHRKCWLMWKAQGKSTCVLCRAPNMGMSVITNPLSDSKKRKRSDGNDGDDDDDEHAYINLRHIHPRAFESDHEDADVITLLSQCYQHVNNDCQGTFIALRDK